MSNLERQLQEARSLLQVDISPEETERALRRLKAYRRRRERRILVGSAALSAVAAGVLLWQVAPWSTPEPVVEALADGPAELRRRRPDCNQHHRSSERQPEAGRLFLRRLEGGADPASHRNPDGGGLG